MVKKMNANNALTAEDDEGDDDENDDDEEGPLPVIEGDVCDDLETILAGCKLEGENKQAFCMLQAKCFTDNYTSYAKGFKNPFKGFADDYEAAEDVDGFSEFEVASGLKPLFTRFAGIDEDFEKVDADELALGGFIYNFLAEFDVSDVAEDSQLGVGFAVRPAGAGAWSGASLWLDTVAADEVSEGVRGESASISLAEDAQVTADSNLLGATEVAAQLPGTLGNWLVSVGKPASDAVEINFTTFASFANGSKNFFAPGQSLNVLVQTFTKSAASELYSSKLSGQNRLSSRYSVTASEPTSVDITVAASDEVSTAFTAAAEAAGVEVPAVGGSNLWLWILIAIVIIAIVVFFLL